MAFTKKEFESNLYDFMELYEHFHNLYEKTKLLSDEIFNDGVHSVELIELRLSEIYCLFNTARLFMSIKGHLAHYEISSLLSFWEQAYLQMYLVAHDNDKNTSWMHSEISNFSKQYEIVEKMLTSHIKELKKYAWSETAD